MRDGRTPAAMRPAAGRRAAIATLAIGALLLVAGLATTLSHAAVRRSGTNDVTVKGTVDTLRPGHQLCQEERIPAGTAAIDVGAATSLHPRTTLTAQVLDLDTLTPIASGVAAGDTPAAASVVRLRPTVAREAAARVCLGVRAAPGGIALLYGLPPEAQQASATDDGHPIGGVVRLDYLRAGRSSWWSFAPTVVERLGRGRAWLGSAVAAIVVLLLLTSIAASAWLLVRQS